MKKYFGMPPLNRQHRSPTFLLCQHIYQILRGLAKFVKMFGRDVDGAVEPCNRPAVKREAGKHVLVAQRGKELVLRDKRQTVEYDTAPVIKVQLQQIVTHDAGGCDPFPDFGDASPCSHVRLLI